jgi:hypothetical protein
MNWTIDYCLVSETEIESIKVLDVATEAEAEARHSLDFSGDDYIILRIAGIPV